MDGMKERMNEFANTITPTSKKLDLPRFYKDEQVSYYY